MIKNYINWYENLDIEITKQDAKRLLIDLEFINQIKEPIMETKLLIKMLKKFDEK